MCKEQHIQQMTLDASVRFTVAEFKTRNKYGLTQTVVQTTLTNFLFLTFIGMAGNATDWQPHKRLSNHYKRPQVLKDR